MPLVHHSRLLLLLLAGSSALAFGGCGSSQAPAQSGSNAQALRFSYCMRAHGVPNFPDPGASSNGFDSNSPALKSAQSACQHLLPVPSGAGQASPAARTQLLGLSECMRAHGVSGFPDPTTARPFRVSSLIRSGDLYLGIPISIDTDSPAFRHAASVCHAPASGF
jgi:hypothetical protein